ncbi:acetyl-CoA C-acetyltransferase [Pseudoalteromonas distincta]|jgi:acetyl-CoA C-acetyltransferase|uniref:acetyl-CoA C-acetyltransferase n=1 Tax=Pseudoalteromonas distincta TaxID=77608 RepID=UPI0011924999|nr:acetyl-CoA C-acetyltransferase [Pseudoalteromonas elyakovii]TVU77077.1 acetyl-CoA C-acetyltransferase [Pseudoalteromonas elyakovii]
MKAVIVAAKRTAIGGFGQSLSSLSAIEIGSQLLKTVLDETPQVKPHIEEVILGQVLTAGCGQNPARQTALNAGLPINVSAFTINHVCGSGLKAVQLAAQSVLCGDAKMVVAGGQESMSQAAHVLPNNRVPKKLGDLSLVDSLIKDGLWDSRENIHMGVTAENIAEKFSVSREAQDKFAVHSQQKAAHAISSGLFKDEIAPIHIVKRGGDIQSFDVDESVKADTQIINLSKLRPAFKKGGSVTAGNSSTINDGAAMVVVTTDDHAKELGLPILAVIEATACEGVDPLYMGVGPIAATQAVCKKADWQVGDIDLIEVNEAFSAQALHVTNELGLDPKKLNVNGGAVALGHPIGASGCRILVSLIYQMQRANKTKGLATLCIGGGMGIAMLVSRERTRA